jgi:hypothetical protein
MSWTNWLAKNHLEGKISPLKMAKVLSQTFWYDFHRARAHAQKIAKP